MITYFQVDITIIMSKNLLSYLNLKLVLTFCINRKQILVTKKIIYSVRLNNDRNNQVLRATSDEV